MKTMYCPFLNREIDSETCLEVSMLTNGEEAERTQDDTLLTAMKDKTQKETCMHCRWHRVYCPVMEDRVDGTVCLEICEVADHNISERIFEDFSHPPVWNAGQREKCLRCKWHADVED